jgi:prevent-host-death family protein
MRILEIAEARMPLADYAADVGGDPIILTRDGRPVAALVSVENTDWETIRLSTHPEFLALIEQSRESLRRGEGLSAEELRGRLDATE